MLCGVGFIVKLFTGPLVMPIHPEMQNAMTMGVIVGSMASGVPGAAARS